MQIILGYDVTTLREKVDLDAAADRLAELGDLRSRSALNEKVGLLRMLGRLDDAWDMANEAVRQARFTGDRHELLRARIRRAQVQQFQGKYDAAIVELSDCIVEANAHDWEESEAYALQHRGKVYFDRRDFAEARADFSAALVIRVRIKAPADEVDSSMVAIAVTESYLGGDEPTEVVAE